MRVEAQTRDFGFPGSPSCFWIQEKMEGTQPVPQSAASNPRLNPECLGFDFLH